MNSPRGLLRLAVGTVRLIHPFPVSVVISVSVLMIFVAHHGTPGAGSLARSVLVVLASQVPVGALNDYLDRHRDARTQPGKPIPSGEVPAWTALALTGAGLVVFVPAALSFGPLSLLVMGVGTAAGLAYDLWLKPTPLSPLPYVVGFLSMFTWIWMVHGTLEPRLLVLYPIGTLLLVAVHLANAFPDIELDALEGQPGLAVRLGPRRTFQAILILYLPCLLLSLGVALAFRNYLAVALDLVSGALAFLAFVVGRERRSQDRRWRVAVFRLVAPAIGILAVGSLLALTR